MNLFNIDPPPVTDPNDPSSKFYCDYYVDDPACYAPGGYYGPGGGGYTGGTGTGDGTYTLPIEVFSTDTVTLVGGALLLWLLLSASGRRRKTKRGGI